MLWSNEARKSAIVAIYGLLMNLIVIYTVNGSTLCSRDGKGPDTNYLTAVVGKDKSVFSPALSFKATCAWIISAPPGNVVIVQIVGLVWTYYTKDACDKEHFKFYDGNTTQAPLIETYCRSHSPRGLIFKYSTGQHMRLQLYTEAPMGLSIMFHYEAIKALGCSGDAVFNLPQASSTPRNFSSPFFGLEKAYPRYANCTWTMHASAGKHIKLTFRINIAPWSATKVIVYDGAHATKETLMKTFCQSYMSLSETELYSTGQDLVVHFVGGKNPGYADGFQAHYEAVDSAASCSPSNFDDANNNIVVSSPSGVITSPGFPVSLPSTPLKCIWRFVAPEGHRIRIDIDSVNLSHDDWYCSVRLYVTSAGYGIGYPLHKVFCRRDQSRVTWSDGRMIAVHYSQPGDFKGKIIPPGFSIRYTTHPIVTSGTCSSSSQGTIELTGEGASFHSPNCLGGSFPLKTTCRWKITVPLGKIVELQIDLAYLRSSSACDKVRVRVFDGPDTTSRLLSTICERSSSWTTYYSTGNTMLIEHVINADTIVTRWEFLATFTALKTLPRSYACRGGNTNVMGMRGRLASHGFPAFAYPNSASCSWHITVPSHLCVALTFISFTLEDDSPNCSKDFVELTGRDVTNDGTIRSWRLCGNQSTTKSYVSVGNNMTVRFESDLIGRFPGFEARWEAVPDPTFGNCSEFGEHNTIDMTTPLGSLASPLYPSRYPENTTCEWVIKVNQGQHVRLVISDFNLGTCESSQVEIRDGGYQGKLIGRFCGDLREPSIIYSTGRVLWVRFRSGSDSSIIHKGFAANYVTVPQVPLSISCTDQRDSVTIKESGILASYDYPLKYQNNVTCAWMLTTESSGKRVRLQFQSFDVEPSDDCTADFVEVRDGDTKGEVLGRYCGQTKPDPITSPSNSLFVTFVSNGNRRYGGFKASFEATWSVTTIVLVAVFSTVGVIAAIAILGYLWKKRFLLNTKGGTDTNVPLNQMQSLEIDVKLESYKRDVIQPIVSF